MTQFKLNGFRLNNLHRIAEKAFQKKVQVPAVRHPLDLRSLGSSKNYEDSIRHRYEMEQEAIMRDSIGRLMIRQSQDIKKKLK